MFGPGTPGTLQGANQFIGSVTNRQPGATPGFSDIFENFYANVERQGKRGSAGLRETFGSQGARFGSDLLRAEGDLQGEISERLIGGAGALRAQEANVTSTLAGALQQSAALEIGQSEAAFDRLIQEYIRRSQPPPLLNLASNYALGLGTAGQPATVIQPTPADTTGSSVGGGVGAIVGIIALVI
jgi:hypothetical protein